MALTLTLQLRLQPPALVWDWDRKHHLGHFHHSVYEVVNDQTFPTMVVGAFPLFKLASLAIKQISKPIANSLKTTAKQSDFFKKYVCVWSGQGTPNFIDHHSFIS